jgi:desulfoferrodoxin (superoxide reductase-like protein)
MNRRKFLATSLAFVGGVVLTYGTAWANRAESRLEVPESAAKGSETIIKLTVTHSANSFLHHVEWAWVQVNGKEVARWDFSSSNLPESETFSRAVKVKMEGNLEIKAKASCNLHGSANEATANVKVIG